MDDLLRFTVENGNIGKACVHRELVVLPVAGKGEAARRDLDNLELGFDVVN